MPTEVDIMKKLILPLSMLIFISFMFSCSNSDQNKDNVKAPDIENVLIQFAKSRNAISNIERHITTDDRDPFTFEVERFINENHNRPILVSGTLEDIISSNGDYILQIHDFLGLSFVYYRLSANNDLVSKIISSGIQKYDDIAAIAKLQRVQKVAFEVSPNGEELDLSSSDTLVFYGECKAYIKIK